MHLPAVPQPRLPREGRGHRRRRLGGRLEMGIGAGWYEHEWRAYGYGFPHAPERLRMLREGVEIMHQAWTTGTASLDGEFFRVEGAIVQPQPLQAGGIPMWVAGGGEKVTLKIAAKYAAYTNFYGGPEEFSRKSEVLRGHTDRLGRDFGSIVRSANFNTVVGEDAADVDRRLVAIEERVARYAGRAAAAKFIHEFRSDIAIAVGTPEQVVERLLEMRERGLGYAIHYFPELAYDRSGFELFEREVMPALA
ncbi:hypothetical protein GCM10025870_23430 [Agromyces marinus]|uniref:Luciferase-like domain-containing protein n=1 Tax=Agromyces marinus TaxID=1389020 RepID=A0ABN6YD20_9MICO|nr:hypothetical protein GCM10025870_23430 [Agromyces marinus]